MTSRLILLGGEAWTGKSTCAEILLGRLHNSAWLDGDDVWRINPWSLEDPRLRTSDVNMAFVVQTYLQSQFDYVILSSIVLSDKEIADRIVRLITDVDYEILSFTLFADRETLKLRAKARDGNTSPHFLLLDRAAKRDTLQIDTSNRTPGQVVDELEAIVRAPEAFGLGRTARGKLAEWKMVDGNTELSS